MINLKTFLFSFIKEEIIEAGVEGDLWIKSPIPGMGTHLHGDVDGEVMLSNYFNADTGQLSTQYVLTHKCMHDFDFVTCSSDVFLKPGYKTN